MKLRKDFLMGNLKDFWNNYKGAVIGDININYKTI